MPPSDSPCVRSKAVGPESTRHPNLLNPYLRTSKLSSTTQPLQPRHHYKSQPHSRDTNLTSLGIVEKSPSRPGPSQHPSQYPLSALYALHQAGYTASPITSPSINLLEKRLAGKAESNYSGGISSTPRSFDDSTLNSRPALDSRAIITSTPTTSERRTSDCSATSSEFSLTSAFPPLSIQKGTLEQPQCFSTTEKSTNGIDISVRAGLGVYLHQKVEKSEAVRLQQSRKSRGEATSKTEDSDSPSVSTRRSQLKPARRPKVAEATAAMMALPLQDTTRSNIVLPGWNEAEHIRPRLRTITLASHRSTPKSPPPPFANRSTKRTDIPPSPMTPRPLSRMVTDSAGDCSLGQSSDVKLQIARPPRSMKRSPSPMRAVKLPAVEFPTYPVQDQEGRSSLDYDGVEWEMLNNAKQKQQDEATLPPSQTESQRSNSSDKWNSIEKWREYANVTIGEAFTRAEEGRRNEETTAFVPTSQSSVSLFPTEKFESMSSIAPSLFFAALSEAPTTPTSRKIQRPSTSPQSPTTSVFVASQQSSPNCNTRQFHRPSTAIKHEPFIVTNGSSSSPYDCRPGQQVATIGKQISPGQKSVVSDVSEVFQSADEGESRLSPPLSLNKSPREHLYRRYNNAQKRASRLFGRSDTLATEDVMAENALRRQSVLHLTTTQLMALSEEAESGRLDTAQWQSHRAQLLTTDEDTSPGDDPTSDSLPTPELSRLSAISRDGDSPNTPESPHWQLEVSETTIEKQQQNQISKPRGYFEEGVFASQQKNSMIKLSPDAHLASPQPPRLVRRRSKRLSGMKNSTDEKSHKPVMTFIKLESLPIQLVEAPTPSSWRSSLSAAEFEDFSKTFGSKEMHRQEVIEELSVTEWNFVISISSILRVFSLPLRKSDLSFQENVPLEVARLFNWLDDILAFHVKLLKSLDKVRNRHPSALVVCVAGAMSKHIEGLSIHQSYLVNFEKVTTLLEEVRRSNSKGELSFFDEVIERQSRLPECRGMALSSFLLKPVQRLMKYPLFFKQLAELTPNNHPDFQETQQLCSLTDRVIRDMNCVKAREEDYQELKLLESRVKGLPDGFHLASRQRRLIKQGSLKSVFLSEMDQLMLTSQQNGDRNFSSAPVTPPLPNFRLLGLKSSTASSNFSPSLLLGSGTLLSPDKTSSSPASHHTGPIWSSLPSESPTSSTIIVQQRTGSLHSNGSSPATSSYLLSETKKSTVPLPPPRPTNRRPSMANLFSRGQMQSKQNDSEDEVAMHAFVFDDLLLLTTMYKEEDKESTKIASKTSKKKASSQSKAASLILSNGVEDGIRYNVISRGGLSRILGVTSRVLKNDTSGISTLALEVEVLPLSIIGEGLISSGSSGSLNFVFSFADEIKAGAISAFDMLPVWEKAFEKSFLSCIQAQRRQTRYAQTDLSSPIFGAISNQRQQNATLTTAQTDWLRRRRHVTQMVNNAAKCGDRTTLTALLQAGLPFPRSPSQQNLSDTANRSVAVVERGSPLLSGQQSMVRESTKEMKALKKSTSQSHLQVHKKSPILGNSFFSTINVDEVARVGDLGSSSMGSRTLEEERREEKTWWSLRLKEIQVEAERSDELNRIIESRRARVVEEHLPPTRTETPTMTKVRRGVPVLKSL